MQEKPTFECIRVWVEGPATHLLLSYLDTDGIRYGLHEVFNHFMLDREGFAERLFAMKLESADRILQRSITKKRAGAITQ